MDARHFDSRTETITRTRRTAPAVAIALVVAAVLIVLYATGMLRIGPTNDGHAVDVDVIAPTTDAPATSPAPTAPASGG
jgi:hypothetical protein